MLTCETRLGPLTVLGVIYRGLTGQPQQNTEQRKGFAFYVQKLFHFPFFYIPNHIKIP